MDTGTTRTPTNPAAGEGTGGIETTAAGNPAAGEGMSGIRTSAAGNPAASAGTTGMQTPAAGNPVASRGPSTGLKVVDMAVEVVRDIDRTIRRFRGRHADLLDQLERAAESIVLNLAEGAGRAGRDKAYHYRVAYASAGEAGAALALLVAYGILDPGQAASLHDRLDQIRAITWRLAHRD